MAVSHAKVAAEDTSLAISRCWQLRSQNKPNVRLCTSASAAQPDAKGGDHWNSCQKQWSRAKR